MLTVPQVKTLGVIGAVAYRNDPLRMSWGKAVVIKSSTCSVPVSTLRKHVKHFIKCTNKYIRTNGHKDLKCVKRHSTVLLTLWTLLKIEKPFPGRSSTITEPFPKSVSLAFPITSTEDCNQPVLTTNGKVPLSSEISHLSAQLMPYANVPCMNAPLSKSPLLTDKHITENPLTLIETAWAMAIKNYKKLKINEEKRSKWMTAVSEWRSRNINHPDYHVNHPEEQKFAKLRDRIDRKVRSRKNKHQHYTNKTRQLELNLTI